MCFINLNMNINFNNSIQLNYNMYINMVINKTHIRHCLGTIEHFLARNDMILRRVESTFNFPPDFQGFKKL